MLPLIGRAEHISLRTAMDIHEKTALMRYDVHIALGPPARSPKENVKLEVMASDGIWVA